MSKKRVSYFSDGFQRLSLNLFCCCLNGLKRFIAKKTLNVSVGKFWQNKGKLSPNFVFPKGQFLSIKSVGNHNQTFHGHNFQLSSQIFKVQDIYENLG